ncbi:hypothetical protein K503DRAFT_625743 [Rhizopogon vinicolor AM-OR11-026]|uniref:Uncharacterized protein n=1 Tax=Rhizopogon vinicolor AM-OR11-026 TaxID=1314800 RepID=A0A1B7MI42_9AGAM|nr:hypothetical protein K503DRAFT_625743 [Rhizopogon vinicolor AM-OR11-026]
MNFLYKSIPLCYCGRLCACASTSLPPSHTLLWVFDSYGYRTDSANAKSGLMSEITPLPPFECELPALRRILLLCPPLILPLCFRSPARTARLPVQQFFVCIWSTVVNFEGRSGVRWYPGWSDNRPC